MDDSLLTQSFQQQQQTQQNIGQNIGQQSQMPYFTNTQLGMQGQAQNLMQQMLQGGMGVNDAARQAAWLDFGSQQAPQLSSIHGSGSPVLNSAAEQLNLKLTAMNNDMMQGNQNNVYRSLAQYAFTPTGQNVGTTQNTMQQQTGQNQGQTSVVDTGAIAGAGLGGLGNLVSMFGS